MGRSAHRLKSRTSCAASRTKGVINRLVEKQATLPPRLCLSSSFHGRPPCSDPAFPLAVDRTLSQAAVVEGERDRKSTRLNSSHLVISYAVFCLKKKKTSYVKLHNTLQAAS